MPGVQYSQDASTLVPATPGVSHHMESVRSEWQEGGNAGGSKMPQGGHGGGKESTTSTQGL